MSCIALPRGRRTAQTVPPLRRLRALACVAALATASGPAWADLAAEEVWQRWQDLAAASGQSLTASQTQRDGDRLTLEGVALTGQGDGLDMAVRLEEITFTEDDDGSVAVRLSDSYDLVLSAADGNLVRLGIRHPGLVLQVSQDGAGLRHDVSAPEIALELEEFSGPDAPDAAALSLSALRVAGHYAVAGDGPGTTTAEISAGALDLDFALEEEGELIAIDYAATGLAGQFAGAGLDRGTQMGIGDMAGALAQGFAVSFGLDYETQRYAIDSVEEGEAVSIAGRATNGTSRFVLDGTELAVSSDSRNAEITLPADALMPALAEGLGTMGAPAAGADPMTLRAGELAYGLRLPTGSGAQPQEASLLLRLVEMTAPEPVWAMLDPTGALARTPVTAVLDVVSRVVLPDDLFGMGTMMGFMIGGPFEVVRPDDLDIRELLVRFGGAELTGDGAFSLDPTDLETFDGVPRPEGVLNLTLRGSDGLIDTLVEAGLLPPDQANAARLLIALLGRPGEGPDELRSTIEIDAAGEVRTNGMRLR